MNAVFARIPFKSLMASYQWQSLHWMWVRNSCMIWIKRWFCPYYAFNNIIPIYFSSPTNFELLFCRFPSVSAQIEARKEQLILNDNLSRIREVLLETVALLMPCKYRCKYTFINICKYWLGWWKYQYHWMLGWILLFG